MTRHAKVALPTAVAVIGLLALVPVTRLHGEPAPAERHVRAPAAGGVPAAGGKGKRGCRPNCRGKTCGSDGCGGDCGTCAKSNICFGNRCVKRGGVGPCRLVAGRWTGSFLIRPVHHLDGRISVSKKACRARFRVTFPVGSGQGWAVEELEVTVSKRRIRFRGLRIVNRSANSSYVLDNFEGTMNVNRTRFLGQLRDASGITGRVVLNKR